MMRSLPNQTARSRQNSSSSSSPPKEEIYDPPTATDSEDDDAATDFEHCSFTSSVQVLPRKNANGGFDVYTSTVTVNPVSPSYFDALPADHEVFISSLQDFSGSWVQVSTESISAKRERANPMSYFAKKKRRGQTAQIIHQQQQLQQSYERQRAIFNHQQMLQRLYQQPNFPPPLPGALPVGSPDRPRKSRKRTTFEKSFTRSCSEPEPAAGNNPREIRSFQQQQRRTHDADPPTNTRPPGFFMRLSQRFGSSSRLSDAPPPTLSAPHPPPLPSKPPIGGLPTANAAQNKSKAKSNFEQFANRDKKDAAFSRKSLGSSYRLSDASAAYSIPENDNRTAPWGLPTSKTSRSRTSSGSNFSDMEGDHDNSNVYNTHISDTNKPVRSSPNGHHQTPKQQSFHETSMKESQTPQFPTNIGDETDTNSKQTAAPSNSNYQKNLRMFASSTNDIPNLHDKEKNLPDKKYTSKATLTLSTRETTSSNHAEKRSIFAVPKAFFASLAEKFDKKSSTSTSNDKKNINKSGYFSSNGSLMEESRVNRNKNKDNTRTSFLNSSKTQTHRPKISIGKKSGEDPEVVCTCTGFHAHGFHGECVNSEIQAMRDRRESLLKSLSVSMATTSSGKNMEAGGMTTKVDNSDLPWNIFWVPNLSFHPHVHGDPLVDFASLWPSLRELRSMLKSYDVQQSILKDDGCLCLALLTVTCGPVRALRCLLELRLIRVDQLTQDSSGGLLHLAVLARNQDSVQYLMAAKVSPSTRDSAGLTADQVCFSPHIRKQLHPRYILGRDISRDRTLLSPSLQDKESIFKLATSPESFVDLQKKLQTLDFNVNTECDTNGDFLLHIACTQGLSQLPLLMALIKIQGADIELCNVQGMTALMMAAAEGNCVLCDVLICLFGANPNKPNSLCGRSALHYAMEGNHRKTVECLIRRGADVNMEDHSGFRPDDIPGGPSTVDDCCEVITFNRNKRLEMLADVVKKGEVASSQLLPYDMCVVDGEGHTLVMMAAIYNRPQSLYAIMNVSTSTINAQHSKTGMTALAIAAQMGNSQAVYVLLKYEACPTVADMNGYLPLHHAIINNHEATIDIFLTFFPHTYQGLYKGMELCCKKGAIYEKIHSAWEKRQYEIVTPKLLGCSLNGDAEELYQLLDEGDNINPKSGTGNWPLYLAVENGHLDVVQLICERGGDICKRHPTSGATALHVAAKMGHQSIVTYLLQFCHSSKQQQQHKHNNMTLPTPSSTSSSGSNTTNKPTPPSSSSPSSHQQHHYHQYHHQGSPFGSIPLPLSSSNSPSPPPTSCTSRLPTTTSGGERERLSGHESTGSETAFYLSKPRRYDANNKSCKRHRMDINTMDKSHTTALQLAAQRGFSRIVDTLLQHGATTAILDSSGQLVTCPQYEGVRIMIESHRQKHTLDIIKCVQDKSKKGLSGLQDVWLPFFDHNLRTKDGQTPLMVAARSGRLPVIKFLLASAVYEVIEEEEEEDLSDTDSGVLDPPQPSPKEHSNKDKFTFNHTDYFNDGYSGGDTRPDLLERESGQPTSNHGLYKQKRLDQMLQDANKPRGLAIYHDNLVSHVCAVHLQDGTTCLHQCLVGGDNPQVLDLFLETDLTPLNVQDSKGETALHLACRLGRKKCVTRLLECPGIDVNIRTLDGLLPEELSNVKSVQKLVEKTRLLHPPPPDVIESFVSSPAQSQGDSNNSGTRNGSSINFDQLHSRYEELKMGGRQQQPHQQQQQHQKQGMTGFSSKQEQELLNSFTNSS